jgi:hypothetical protein
MFIKPVQHNSLDHISLHLGLRLEDSISQFYKTERLSLWYANIGSQQSRQRRRGLFPAKPDDVKPGDAKTGDVRPADMVTKPETRSLSPMYKPKSDSWKYDGFYVPNNADVLKCIACGTIQPKVNVQNTTGAGSLGIYGSVYGKNASSQSRVFSFVTTSIQSGFQLQN